MDKVLVGLLFGLILGAIDGATAWFYPEVRSMMASIMVGSSIKGMVVGLSAAGSRAKCNPRLGESWWAPRSGCCSPFWWPPWIR